MPRLVLGARAIDVLVYTATQAHQRGTLSLGSDTDVSLKPNMQSIHDVSAINTLFTSDFFCFHTRIIPSLAILVNCFAPKKVNFFVAFLQQI
jgi:hypothetical protein